MNKVKFFVLGFVSCLLLTAALSYVAFLNVTHSLLLSKIDTEVTFVEAAAKPDGVENIRSVISINLANDYCAAKQLGEHVLIRRTYGENKVYDKVKSYIVKHDMKDHCFI